MMKNLLIFLSLLLCQAVYPESNGKIQYLYPIPQSTMLAKETVLIIRFERVMPSEIINLNSFVNIHGSKSGDISGKTVICTDQKTINFIPDQHFKPSERISVTLNPKTAREERAWIDSTYHFDVSPVTEIPARIKEQRFGKRNPVLEKNIMPMLSNGQNPQIINGISVPSDFPLIEITTNDNPDTGLIFLTGKGYTLILNNDGLPVWYWPIGGMNFRVQHGLMTVNIWEDDIWDGPVGIDSTYTIVKKFQIPPGYWFDDHELKLMANGNYLLIVNDGQQMDLTYLGGQPNAWVVGNHVAEMDADDNLVFFWRSWDYFDIADAIYVDPGWDYIDYIHMNSIDVDLDGNIVISSRHLSEITNINRQTGDIIWRLGGENDDFIWVNDSYRTSYQHDARVLPNGNLTLFDNGNFREPEFSRALELSMDATTWEITKVWEYRENPDIFSGAGGSVQRFPNGNTGICWGDEWLPKLTEIRPDKSKAFELDFKDEVWTFRVQRASWKGKAAVPFLVIEPQLDSITLIFNKFGDSDVQEYKIYGGLDPEPTEFLATTTEPFIHLTDLINHQNYFFRVTAVNSNGQESGFSNEEETYTRFVSPGENIVFNGDFSQGLDFWEWEIGDGVGDANIYVTQQNELCFEIFEYAYEPGQIQARYEGVILEQGKEYILEFDGYATDTRFFSAEVMQDGNNLSKMDFSILTENNTHFSHQFVPEEETTFYAKIVLSAGGASPNVYVDNVSLKEVVTVIDPMEDIPATFRLEQNIPNPFNPMTMINYQLPMINNVELSIYNLLGQRVETLVKEQQRAGFHQVEWDANPQNGLPEINRINQKSSVRPPSGPL
jgi:hypothetical protein